MTIKAVIFDLGGVLVRTEFPEVRRRLELRLGLEPDAVGRAIWGSKEWELAQTGALSYEDYWHSVGAKLGLSSPQEIADFRREYFSADRVDQELVRLIEALRACYKIALLSNAPDKLGVWLENDWGISHLFDAIVYSADVGMVKPDPRIYQLTLKRLAVEPSEALFVDDYSRNVEAAVAVGMKTILFTSTQALKEALKPYVVWGVENGGSPA
jgi:epoxide hydrolase-like predicted phosphatase